MAKNKIITSQGNVQFINSKGKTISMHPMHCYAVYQDDTVSFLFIYMKEYSGQAFFASQFEDLEVDGETYDSIDALKEAIAEAFAKAGAQARTEIVDELPETGYTNTIYLIKKEHGEGYDEYIYNEEKGWQLIGDTDIEFERYLQKVDFNEYSADTKEKIDFISGAVDDNASDIQFISGAVSTEISNREAADAVISGAVDTLSTNLSNEVSRAQNAEQTLQNNINTVNSRVDAEQLARANADTALSGAIDSVVSDLASEVSRATAKENEIDSKVDGEISNREAADSVISGAVDSLSANLSLEVQRAQNAEGALNTKVNALSGAIDTVDSKVDTLSGEVQTMGDEAVVDAAYVSSSTTIDFYNASGDVVAQVDATDFVKDGMIEDVRIEEISGVTYLVIDFNTASGKEDIKIPLTDIFNPDNYYDKTAVDGKLADKADLSALTEDERVLGEAINDLNLRVESVSGDVAGKLSTNVFNTYTADTKLRIDSKQNQLTASDGIDITNDVISVTGKVDTTAFTAYSASVETALSGKQDTLIAGDNITISGNVISATGGGGGKAIEAGRGISITTGETADTVSFNLPISAGTGANSVIEGYQTLANGSVSHAEGAMTQANGIMSHAEGSNTIANGNASHAEGSYTIASGNSSHAEGSYTIANNESEHASGQYNVSNKANTTFGDSGNTLFSVGNGTADKAKHNAFEIRQNGDIYLNDGSKLQDTVSATTANTTALGGLSLVKLTQAEYDALATKDSNTLYIISD